MSKREPRRRRGPSQAPFPDLGPLGTAIPISTGTAMLEQETDGSITLYVNGVPSSGLHPDPQHLEFEYMRWIQLVVRAWAGETSCGPSRSAMEVAHLGGGGCSLPRALVDQWPASRHVVVERDALLAEQVRTWFSLPRSPQLRIRVEDATAALASWRPARFDVVIRDVFSGNVTPLVLTSQAVAQHVRRVLRPGGLYLANSAAPPGTRTLADEVATLSSVFPHVGVIAEPAHISGKRRGNCVLAASTDPLPEGIDRALRSDPVSVRLAPRADVRALAERGRVVEVPIPEPAPPAGAPGA
ncbi:spermidine synthase [Brachybacterium hainanense]|uniref:Spermidine synthase n=1 Tax=Brachybacterium hainanense TaxID=1541174 RepID=A0ABV6RES6_9MICO